MTRLNLILALAMTFIAPLLQGGSIPATPTPTTTTTTATESSLTYQRVSPGGSTILATDRQGDRLCLVTIDGGEERCLDAPFLEAGLIDARSIMWSPDGNAIAFSLNSAISLRDSDIFVLDTDTMTLANLTDEEGADVAAPALPLGGDSGEWNVDLYPSWSPDGSQLAFARTVWGGTGNQLTTDIFTIPSDGGDPTPFALSIASYPINVSGPMLWDSDDRLLFGMWPPEIDHPSNGVFAVERDGEPERIGANDLQAPQIVAVNQDHTRLALLGMAVEAADPQLDSFFDFDPETGDLTPYSELLTLPSDVDGTMMIAPAFEPEGDRLAAVILDKNTNDLALVVCDTDGACDLVDTFALDSLASTINMQLAWSPDGVLTLITGDDLLQFEAP